MAPGSSWTYEFVIWNLVAVKTTTEEAGVVGSWVHLHSKNFDDEMAYHRNAGQVLWTEEVVPDCSSLELVLNLIGTPCFVEVED